MKFISFCLLFPCDYQKDGKQATADTVNIPTMNETSGNVKYSGNCSLENGNAQQLVITFNGNWTVALTFARGGSKASSMLQATSSEYSLRDIEFVYYLETAFFPNISATQQGGYSACLAEGSNIAVCVF